MWSELQSSEISLMYLLDLCNEFIDVCIVGHPGDINDSKIEKSEKIVQNLKIQILHYAAQIGQETSKHSNFPKTISPNHTEMSFWINHMFEKLLPWRWKVYKQRYATDFCILDDCLPSDQRVLLYVLARP